MKLNSASDRKVIELLEELKSVEPEYPQQLLSARRADVLSQLPGIVASAGVSTVLPKSAPPPASAAAPMTPIMKGILVSLLATSLAVATYIGVLVYENRDLFIDHSTPTYSETAPPTEASTASPQDPLIVGTETPIVTPTAIIDLPEEAGGEGTDYSVTESPNDNPGLHLGETPHSPGDPPGQDNPNKDNKDTKENQGKGGKKTP